MDMKNLALAAIVMVTMATGCTSSACDTEITPQWKNAPTEEALGMWVHEVQGVIDTWQAVLGDDCEFPLWIGTNGPPVALVAVADWQYHGSIGMYDPDDGSVYVEGLMPRRDGTTQTLSHELGHAAGLHHSLDKHSIMFAGGGATAVPTAVDATQLRRLLGCRQI